MSALFVSELGAADGPVVAMVHGGLDRSAAFVRVARHLPAWRTLRYDRRGYAHSIDVPATDDLQVQVDDLVAVLAGRAAVVVGHSFGGTLALALAARRPDLVRALVAYESPQPWAPWWPAATAGAVAGVDDLDPGDAAEAFMRAMVGDERWAALPERTRRQRRAEGPALLADLRSIRPPAPAPFDPATLAVPVVAAHGTRSRPHHVATARHLAEDVPGAVLRVVDGADHAVHLTHPEAVAGLVAEADRLATAQGR